MREYDVAFTITAVEKLLAETPEDAAAKLKAFYRRRDDVYIKNVRDLIIVKVTMTVP